MASRFRRSSPDPRFGSVIELHCGHLHGSLNFISIGETLPSEGITTEKTPPAFLQIEPAGALGNEDMLEAWMVCQPSAGFQAVMAAQIVCNDEDITRRVVCFDKLEQFDVILGIARGGTARDLLPITDA